MNTSAQLGSVLVEIYIVTTADQRFTDVKATWLEIDHKTEDVSTYH